MNVDTVCKKTGYKDLYLAYVGDAPASKAGPGDVRCVPDKPGGVAGTGDIIAPAIPGDTMKLRPGVYKVFLTSDVASPSSDASLRHVKDGDQFVVVVDSHAILDAKKKLDPALTFGAELGDVYGSDAATRFVVYYLDQQNQTPRAAAAK